MLFADPVSALPHINAGTLLALAVTSRERSPAAPNMPAISEAAIPVSTPSPGNKLNAKIVAALKDPETNALLQKQAMQTVGNSPEDFAGFIRQDIAVWKEVADQAKVEVR